MTYKERAVQLLDQIPESKMFYIIGILEGAAIPEDIPNEETLAAFAEVDEMKKTAPDKDSKILMIYGPVWRIDMLNIIYSGQFHFSLLT